MPDLVLDLLRAVHAACEPDRSGEAEPGIAGTGVDEDGFGVCVATVDGHAYAVGDTDQPFCLQSISKAFTYGIALGDAGLEAVTERIDVEPSGEAFNEISLDPRTRRPRNPMINAGAIAAVDLVDGEDVAARRERILGVYSAYAGRDLDVDEAVLAEAIRTGDRNRAIGFMLREAGVLRGEVSDALEVYLHQCSILVTCRDLALMGATLATAGVHPLTGERVIAETDAERVLSVMTTCGMYDSAGDWVADVGMPAKSGVGGGIVAVLPGQLAVGVFSPRLDRHGNSVRGIQACERLSRDLELHLLNVTRGARAAVHAVYGLGEVPTLRDRGPHAEDLLERHAPATRIYELHGDVSFSEAEAVVRAVSAEGDELEALVLDLRRCEEVAGVARDLLRGAATALTAEGRDVVVVDPGHRLGDPPDAAPDGEGEVRRFPDVREAASWCEDRLLRRHGLDAEGVGHVAAEEHPFVRRLPEEHRDGLLARLAHREPPEGELFQEAGEPEALALVLHGRLRMLRPGQRADRDEGAVLAAGATVGAGQLAGRRAAPTALVAEGGCVLLELEPDDWARLRAEDPALALAVLEALTDAGTAVVERALRAFGARNAATEARPRPSDHGDAEPRTEATAAPSR